MHLIYVYGGCSPRKYKEYIEDQGVRVQQQSQKYNQLLMEGLVKNGARVDAVSSRPINRRVGKKLFYKGERDAENGIQYFYVPFVNYPILRNVTVFFGVFWKVLFMRTEKERAMICDALNIVASFAAWLACKIRGIKTVGIVTDVPCHRPSSEKVPFHEKINLALMKKMDGYLLLTEQMSRIVNPQNRPYVVLEGHSDIAMGGVENHLEDKNIPRICLYAGTLRKIYGIGMLVEGFLKANIPSSELHIYGSGDYQEELKEISCQHASIKYMGVVPNSVIVEKELAATLLINPRPTNEEYTKYSFPSKNMEYMASGTPVLTTKLPGMPKEYNEHVFLLEKEDADGVADALQHVFKYSDEALHKKGAVAKEFVMREKNNVVQASKVLDMICSEV